MKLRSWLLLILLGFVLLSGGNQAIWGDSEPAPLITSKAVYDIQLIYGSKEINEAPFFVSGSVAFESGDNHNDSLAFIPFGGFDSDVTRFNNPALFTELENPRPDVPEGKGVVFSAIGKNGKKGIYLIDKFDVYALGKAKITPLWSNAFNNWHPFLNSKQGILAFISDAAGAPQLFVLDLKSQKTRQLTFLAQASSPFIDAAGEWIYFTGVDQNGNFDIYKIKPDGTGLTRLTYSPEIEKYPTLTKYGKWIVYERGTQMSRSIWIMSLDGKIQKQISDPAHWMSAPCMNYTGTKVVFEGVINNRRGIYLGEVSDDIFSGGTAQEYTPGIDVSREVVNLSQFGVFTPDELQKLSAYGFLVVPTANKQLFYTYEENEYQNIPSFVTADNLLQLLHIIFDTSLRKTEAESLLPKLNQFSQAVMVELEKRKIRASASAKDPVYLSLRRYFEILYFLGNNKSYPRIDPADQSIVSAELARIKAGQFGESALFPKQLFDYSLFKVRGHYDTSEALRAYFKAMSWIGNITFNTRNVAERRFIALAADVLSANPAIVTAFGDLYRVTSFYAGPSDDPNLYTVSAVWQRETGTRLTDAEFDDTKMQQVLQRLFSEQGAKITTHFSDPAKNKNEVLGLMGARYVADSHLFSLLFERLGHKYQPGGLDLFAALGNDTAYQLITAESPTLEKFPGFDAALTEGKQIFAGIGEKSDAPLFAQWLRLLKLYANSGENGAPAVLKTEHWKRKKLNTSLASWAELKHDTILYGKQTGAECGGGDEPPRIYGYIEPELTFYKNLRATLSAMDRELKGQGTKGIPHLDQFLELVDFFILVSDKELKKLPLSTQENEQIRIIGGLLEANTVNALDAQMRWWEITSESAKNMAVVADLYRYEPKFATVGVGYSDDLYIIIPVNGQLYLMRGSVFSFYSFLSGGRLSDSEWYELLKTWETGKRATWWQKYLDPKKEKIPAAADPYNSGC